MSIPVNPDDIEGIVGSFRRKEQHLGRAVSKTQTVYIMHSFECKEHCSDLTQCEFSRALDRGIDEQVWSKFIDQCVGLTIIEDKLSPYNLFCNGICIMGWELIEGASGVAYPHPDCDLHGN